MKILLIISEIEKREKTSRYLTGNGYDVEVTANEHQGFYRALSGGFSVVVLDPWTPGWDQENWVKAIIEARPLLRIILLAPGDKEVADLEKEYSDMSQVESVLKASELPGALVPLLTLQGKGHSLRQAKIIATIGPASCGEETIRALITAGVNLFRFNFSHGDYQWHEKIIKRVRRISGEMNSYVAILQDLCGPKIRVGKLEGGEVELVDGKEITISRREQVGTDKEISISTDEVLDDLREGDRILLDDGNLELMVEKSGQERITCSVVHGGILKEHKGVNFPGASLNLPGLMEKDKKDLAFGIKAGVDYVAISFVRKAEHVEEAKELIRGQGADIPVIAKIEKPEAVASIKKIMKASNGGIMIARGDLGVELPEVRVPYIQEQIIKMCRESERPVITATQMLESMIEKPRPTRAEVADIAKAIEDGTDAVMLSGETASGRYPVNAVETMSAVVMETESRLRDISNPFLYQSKTKKLVPALSKGLALISDNVDLAVIAVATHTGRTVCSISKTHPDSPIIALSDNEEALRRVCLYHGVFPAKLEDTGDTEEILKVAQAAALKLKLAQKGDMIALVWDPEWQGGAKGSLATRFKRI